MSEPTRASVGRLIVAVTLAATLMPLNSTMVAVALPDIGKQLVVDPATLTQALVASYLVTGIVLQSPGGKLGDRLGHRRSLVLGELILAAGAAIGFLSRRIELLALSRVLMATGGAIVIPSAVALLRTELPLERRGGAFGAFGGCMALAAAVGPLLGGELTRRFGWPAIFLANVPIIALSLALASAGRVSARPAQVPRPFDFVGSIVLAFALTMLVLGVERGGGSGLALSLVGAVAFVPFALWERRAADPVVDLSLFKNRVFAAGGALIALQNLAMYALIFELPHVFEKLFAFDARATGRTLVFLMASMVVSSPFAGRLTDRYGARLIAVIGSLASIAALGLMLGRPLTSPSALIGPFCLLGVGLSLASAPAQTASMSAVGPAQSGMAAGVNSTLRYLGGVAGIAVLGQIMTDASDPQVVLAEHRTALAVFLFSLIIAGVCAFAMPGRPPQMAAAAAAEKPSP